MTEFAISLSTIPPRFGHLGPVLEALTAQGAAEVFLVIPIQYQRFPGWTGDLPSLPSGVKCLRGRDTGPATKLLGAQDAAAKLGLGLVLCDDDWVYHAGWLETLTAQPAPASGQTFDIGRVVSGWRGPIGQAYAGLSVPPQCIAARCPAPPNTAIWADDIWISAWLASLGAGIIESAQARRLQSPLSAPHALQDTRSGDAYARAAHCARAAFGPGLWGGKDTDV